MANKIRDLAGVKVGMLTVIEKDGVNDRGRYFWICKCDCGNKIRRLSSIIVAAINKNKNAHCGCTPPNKSHGLSKHEKHLYWVWASIIQRCENMENKDYHSYGGRGIGICSEWRYSFKSFHDWAKTNGYKRGLTIERKDVNKGYNPYNCEWIVNERQSLNCRRSALITYKGETKHISDWSAQLGINYKTLRGRIFDYGWDIERALTEKPVKGKNQYG